MPASSAIGELVLKFTADIADILTNTERVKNELNSFASDVSGTISQVKGIVQDLAAAFAAFESVKFLGNIVTDSIDAQAQLELLAQKTGITVEELSSLANVGATVGLSLQDSASQLSRFEKNMNDAASGTGKAADALRALGFSAQQISGFLKDPGAALVTIAQRLGDFSDGIGKTTAEIDLFGRAGAQLAPFLKKVADEGLGAATVTALMAENAERLSEAWNTLRNGGQQLINQVVGQTTPALTALVEAFGNVSLQLLGVQGGIKDLIARGGIGDWVLQAGLAVAIFADHVVDLGHSLSQMGTEIIQTGKVIVDYVKLVNQSINATEPGGTVDLEEQDRLVQKLKQDWGDLHFVQNNTPSTASQEAYKKALADYATTLAHLGENAAGAALQVDKFSDAQNKLAQAQAAYDKALNAVDKASADALLKQQEEGLKEELAQAQRAYDEGLISFQDYYNKQLEIQSQSLADQETALRKQIADQNDLIATLQKNLANLSPGKTDEATQAARLKIETEIANALKTRIDLEGKLGVVVSQGTQVGVDYVNKYLIPENKLILESIPALQDKVKAAQLEATTIGLTTAQIQANILARDEELLAEKEAAGASEEVLNFLRNEIAIRKQLTAQLQSNEDFKLQIQGWQDVLTEAQTVFTNILTNGKNTWSQLTQWLKDTLVKELFSLAATKFIIPLIVDITGNAQLGQALTTSLTNSLGNTIGNIFGASGGTGSILNSISSGLGSLFTSGGIAGSASELTEFATGATVASDAIAGLAGTIGAAIPYVGIAIAAYELLKSAGVFNKSPTATSGQFGFESSGTSSSTFEDQSSVTTKLGNLMLGFLDQGTKEFSGQASLVFDNVVSGALDAFQSRFSNQQSDQLATILKNMIFQSFQGTYTTEDFIQKYGGQILQQVVQAAFSVLDPALASVDSAFSGTADEVAKFANSLLSIYDIGQQVGGGFGDKLAAAFGDTTGLTGTQLQALADKIQAFGQIVATFGDTLSGVGPKLQALDPSVIVSFIDALGGAQAALSSFQYLYANFTTSTQKAIDATNALNTAFTNLGVTAIPQTHQQFLDLLDSIDLTTTAGQQLYASLLALAPQFVAVHGTADQAAASLGNVSDALSTAAQSAQDFFNKNFYTSQEQAAKQLAADQQQVADAEQQLGVHIPETVDGFRQLIEGIDQTTDDGKKLYAALILLAPAIFDIANAAKTASTTIADAATNIGNTIANLTTSAGSEGDYQKTASTIVNKFLSAIATLAQAAPGSDLGDQLGTQINLITSQIANYQAQYAAEIAKTGGIIDDTAATIQDEISILQDTNTQFASQLANFTILKAQYGASIAQQLVDLETWYQQQQRALNGNADALAALNVIYTQKWNDIVNGVSAGVTGTTSQLAQLVQAIKDFVKSLTISDLSPLTPIQKLTEAQSQYNAELALAQQGNQTAIGDITKYAQAYLQQARAVDASSQAYTDIFNAVVGQLNNIADTTVITDNFGNPPGAGGGTGSGGGVLFPPSPGTGAGDGTGGNSGGGTKKNPLTVLTDAIPPGSTLSSSADTATVVERLDQINTDVKGVQAAIIALSNAGGVRTDKQIAAAELHTQRIINNLGRKSK